MRWGVENVIVHINYWRGGRKEVCIVQISIPYRLVSNIFPVNFVHRGGHRKRCQGLRAVAGQEHPWHLGGELRISHHRSRIELILGISVVGPIKMNLMTIHEYQRRRDALGTSKGSHTLDNRIRSWEFHKMVRLMTRPIARLRKLYVPWRLPVGPRQMTGMP
jgi:hypothetical protein